mgnify:CR=1 FL=1
MEVDGVATGDHGGTEVGSIGVVAAQREGLAILITVGKEETLHPGMVERSC